MESSSQRFEDIKVLNNEAAAKITEQEKVIQEHVRTIVRMLIK